MGQYTANNLCKVRWNGTLASIHGQKLNNFLATDISGGKPAWIGGYRKNSWVNGTRVITCYWYDQSKWDYTNWTPNTNTSRWWFETVSTNFEKPGLWNIAPKYATGITGYICQKL